MLRKDFIEKQLEQLSIAIAKALSEITKAKGEGKTESAIFISDELMQREFDIPLNELISIESETVIEYLIKKKQLSLAKTELLADALFASAQVYEDAGKQMEAENIYKKLMIIYTYINETGKTFSLNREERITLIKSKI